MDLGTYIIVFAVAYAGYKITTTGKLFGNPFGSSDDRSDTATILVGSKGKSFLKKIFKRRPRYVDDEEE